MSFDFDNVYCPRAIAITYDADDVLDYINYYSDDDDVISIGEITDDELEWLVYESAERFESLIFGGKRDLYEECIAFALKKLVQKRPK